MVQGGMSVVKFLMFAFNFVFVICGIALISVGAIAQTSGKEYTEFLGSKFVTAPILVIIVGCIIFFIAFLGCCGAIKQNYCMVVTFGILLFLIFIIEISGGIAAYVYRGELENLIQKNMNNSLNNRTTTQDAIKMWDEMEIKLHCCGVEGPEDYDKRKLPVPDSCCGKAITGHCNSTIAQHEGCYPALNKFMESKIAVVGGAGIGIAVIEVLGMIFAWCLGSAIKKEYEGV